MLSISTQFAAYAPAAQPLVQARASVVMESKASLEALAKELNPSIGYWDPIGLANLGGNDGSPASGEAVGADSIGPHFASVSSGFWKKLFIIGCLL